MKIKKEIVRYLDQYIKENANSNESTWMKYIFELDHSSNSYASLSRSRLIVTTLGVNKNSLRLASAIEFVHNASLIIDDVIDKSLFRRDRLSFWNEFSKEEAILFSHVLIQKSLLEILNTDYEHEVQNSLIRHWSTVIQEMALNEIDASNSDLAVMDDYSKRILARSGSLYGLVGKVMSLNTIFSSFENELIETLTELGAVHQISDDLSDSDPSINHAFMFVNRKSEEKNSSDSIFALASNTFGIDDMYQFHHRQSEKAIAALNAIVINHHDKNEIMNIAREICSVSQFPEIHSNRLSA